MTVCPLGQTQHVERAEALVIRSQNPTGFIMNTLIFVPKVQGNTFV